MSNRKTSRLRTATLMILFLVSIFIIAVGVIQNLILTFSGEPLSSHALLSILVGIVMVAFNPDRDSIVEFFSAKFSKSSN